MTDKPILFSGAMVRAILREIEQPGTGKRQTRRAPFVRGHKAISEFGKSSTDGYDWHFRDQQMRWHDYRHSDLLQRLPYCVGDRLYVREAWRTQAKFDFLKPSEVPLDAIKSYEADFQSEPNDGCRGKYRHGRFMPRCFSRITLEVTDVRIQCLQEISANDAIAEGIEPYAGIDPRCDGFLNYHDLGESGWWLPPCESFKTLWDSINGKPRKPNGPDISWAANPWVVAYTFKPHLCNIDQMEKAA